MPERLFAPWRFDYVQTADAPKESGTGDIFLDLPAENRDAENLILHRGQTAFVIMNRYPYTSGHVMVAPYRQTADFEDLGDEELLEINQLVGRCVAVLKRTHSPDGFNVGINLGRAAGAGIPVHIHWHVVPRWAGDTNFMTTVGDVRVIPQDLDQTYALLREAWAARP